MRITTTVCDICKKTIPTGDYIYTTDAVKFMASPTPIMPHDRMDVMPVTEMCHNCAHKIKCAVSDILEQI